MQLTNLFTLALGATLVAAAPVVEQESEITKRTDAQFIKDILDAHNFFRKQHGAPDIKWDQTLADFGQGVTNTCNFKHSGGKYGECLAGGTNVGAVGAVNMWGAERTKFDFNNGAFGMDTGHFTQVVWKESVKVGCGITQCKKGQGTFEGSFVACEYQAFGNMGGQFRKNVGGLVGGAKLTDKFGA